MTVSALVVVSCSGSSSGPSANDIHAVGPTTSRAPTTTEPPTTSMSLATTVTSLPSAFPATRSDIGLGWVSVEIPTSVVAPCHRTVVGTDTELIFWGGVRWSCDYEFPTGDPGMAYNPDTGMWRQLPKSPLEPVVAPAGVWTGSEVIICCGMTWIRIGAHQRRAESEFDVTQIN
jgi:hypothetical protein